MKKYFALTALMVTALSLATLQSCQKESFTATQDEVGFYDFEKYMPGYNAADQYVDTHTEEVVMTEATFELLAEQDELFSDELLRTVFTPGIAPDTSLEARKRKYDLLKAQISNRDAAETRIETIFQLTATKRCIDASPNEVALTYANFGATVTSGTNGNISYDYHKSSLNKITSTDIFLANWALATTNQGGSQFIADDDLIEFQDEEPTFLFEVSGGTFFIEAVVIYNGPPTLFTYYDVFEGAQQTVTIETGELMVYGSDSQYGELFFNLTLTNETPGSDTYVDAQITGPIVGGTFFTLSGGPWPS